jgi:putative ABC transport system permease protein
MLRNYLVTAWRNLARNWLYGGIGILGLAVALTAALLIAQFVRGEFSYDHWIPGYLQVYKITGDLRMPGQLSGPSDQTNAVIAGNLKAAFPGAAATARLMEDFPGIRHRSADTPYAERGFAWADPDIFKVFPLPVLAGDLGSALQQPGAVVITRSAARRYFHRDLPIGDTLQVQTLDPRPPGPPQGPPHVTWQPMRVTAVIEDLPPNTNLTTEIFASGRSAYSGIANMETHAGIGNVGTYSFVRLKPGISEADLQRALDLAGKPEAALFASIATGGSFAYHPLPLAEAHLTPAGETAEKIKPQGSRTVAFGLAGVGALIALVAAINFVTLTTARASRRGVEVGVRKATGASRLDLMTQFIGEALVQVAVATAIAVALAELLLPAFNTFVQRGLALDFLHDPWLLVSVMGAALAVGLLAAVYPALVLSGFRPGTVLKGGAIQASGSPRARSVLVVVQFAILVSLIVTATTIYRQTQYALGRGLGAADSRLIFSVYTPCDAAFPKEAVKLPGVAALGCSSVFALNTPNYTFIDPIRMPNGAKVNFNMAPVDFGFFEVFGVRPLAGRLFSRDHGQDGALSDPKGTAAPTVVVNETAARTLGFADPKAALGQRMTWGNHSGKGPATYTSEIIGVVPNLPVTVRTAANPTFYIVAPGQSVVSIRLTGQDIGGTVRAVEALWKRLDGNGPIQESFLAKTRANLYLDLIVQRGAIAIGAGLAISIACLGLFALSAYTTERRTKEIGVRKVMGADTLDVVRLLLWQFTLPVLAAVAVALPLGFLAMNWWLSGFVYHVSLTAWTFVLAAVAGVAIAWITVSWQSFVVARAKPASALRYE